MLNTLDCFRNTILPRFNLCTIGLFGGFHLGTYFISVIPFILTHVSSVKLAAYYVVCNYVVASETVS